MATYETPPEPRTVEISRASEWLTEGWQIFTAAPGVWVAISLVFLVINVLFSMIPGLGSLASMLLTPVLFAGLLECSRIVSAGGVLQFDQMFAGFRRNTGNLVMIGLITLGAMAVVAAIAFAIVFVGGGAGTLSAIQTGTTSGASIGLALGGLVFGALIGLLLIVPITMAWWFAPALVMFDGMAPLEAMKSSYMACLHNWVSLSIQGILVFVLIIIAAITLGLGLLVLVPVATASIFISYRDIYH
ncbi:MAG: DUF2189 domain-containing protein [Verrucomicrobia bacterium]|nr:MAG: DUF2189 domain-containing protein [Verrucomicrobiota bacterium]